MFNIGSVVLECTDPLVRRSLRVKVMMSASPLRLSNDTNYFQLLSVDAGDIALHFLSV